MRWVAFHLAGFAFFVLTPCLGLAAIWTADNPNFPISGKLGTSAGALFIWGFIVMLATGESDDKPKNPRDSGYR